MKSPYLSIMELQWVISAQRDSEPPREVVRQGIAVVTQEQRVVAQR